MRRSRSKKPFVILIVVALVLIILSNAIKPVGNFFSGVGSFIFTPVQRLSNWVGGGVGGISKYFSDKSELEKENIELKEKISQYMQQLRDYEQFKNENNSLRAALKLKSTYKDFTTIGGNIIAKEAGNWFNTFTIDAGSAEGVKVDSPVVNGDGLIGRVSKVNPHSSVIVSVIDPWCKVSATNARTGKLAICVRGDINLAERGLCRLEYIDPDIEIGDMLVTSGISDIYPKNIIIGKVKELSQSENELNSYAVVEPAVDFSKIREAFVLVSK